MSINKNAMKQFISEQILKRKEATSYEIQIKYLNRLESICRAAINRVSYALSFDTVGSIYLKSKTKTRFIEAKTNDAELCKRVYLEATEYIKAVKDRYLEQSGEANA